MGNQQFKQLKDDFDTASKQRKELDRKCWEKENDYSKLMVKYEGIEHMSERQKQDKKQKEEEIQKIKKERKEINFMMHKALDQAKAAQHAKYMTEKEQSYLLANIKDAEKQMEQFEHQTSQLEEKIKSVIDENYDLETKNIQLTVKQQGAKQFYQEETKRWEEEATLNRKYREKERLELAKVLKTINQEDLERRTVLARETADLQAQVMNAEKIKQSFEENKKEIEAKHKHESAKHQAALHDATTIKLIIDEYTILRDEIGKGMFGIVYHAINTKGDKLAAKHIDMSSTAAPSADMDKHERLLNSEKEVSKNLQINEKHPNVVNILHISHQADGMYIIMEHCDQNFEKYYVSLGMKMHINEKIQLMLQIAEGIKFLHSHKIVHRDIKPENLLVKFEDDQVVIKLADYGLAKQLDPDLDHASMATQVGTPIFQAPEVSMKNIKGKTSYHIEVDIFSTGLTFLAMLQGPLKGRLVPKIEGDIEPFYQTMAIAQVMAFKRQVQQPQPEIVVVRAEDCEKTKLLKLLIANMLTIDTQHRPAAADVVHRVLEALAKE